MQAALLRTLTKHKNAVSSVAFSSDGSVLAGGGGYADNSVRLWDARTWEPRQTLRGHKGDVTALAFRLPRQTLAGASHDKRVNLWDLTRLLKPRPVK
jgi:WD40 repeat protein